MQTNNHKIVDYDAVLDAKFGKEGTPERARAEEAISKIENGVITPSVGVFYRIIAALGMRVEVVKPVY